MAHERRSGRVIPVCDEASLKRFSKDFRSDMVRPMRDYIWAFIPSFATITIGLVAILYFSEFKKQLIAKKMWLLILVAANSVLLFMAWPFILAIAIKRGIDRVFEG